MAILLNTYSAEYDEKSKAVRTMLYSCTKASDRRIYNCKKVSTTMAQRSKQVLKKTVVHSNSVNSTQNEYC
jgi:hypothetical protein